MNFSFFENKSPHELVRLLQAYQEAIDVNLICSITDVKGRIIYVNKLFCDVCKFSKEELIGQNHSIINSGHHPKSFFKDMWATVGKGNVWRNDVRNKAKDGSFYWVDTVILPIRDENDKIMQYLSLRKVITEWKDAEKEKEKYIRALEHMLKMTSHRVRSPLSSCMGLLELYNSKSNNTWSAEEMQQLFAHVKTSAQELDLFTRELTSFIYELIEKRNT